MSELFPDVSLEESEESAEESETPTDQSSERDSSKELQNSSSTTSLSQQAPAKVESPTGDKEGSTTPSEGSAPSSQGAAHQRHKHGPNRENLHQTRERASAQDAGASPNKLDGPEEPLSVHPLQRPNLGQKLGPYVSDDVNRALEEVYLTLRRRFGSEASKSLIVEAALRYVLSDCLKRGADSELTRWFERVLAEP